MAERRVIKGWIVERGDDGVMRPIAPAGDPQMPADPTFQTKGPMAQAELQNRTLQNQRAPLQMQGDALGNAKTAAEIPYVAPRAAADASKAATEAQSAARMNGLSPETYAKANAQWQAATQLDRIIGDMRSKFAQGPGTTHGIAGIKDYLPSEANQRFDKSGSQARGIVRNALGLTGGEANTAAEANLNLGGYIPDSNNFDGTNADIFSNLESLRDSAREQAIRAFGGVPDANGNITPIQPRNAMLQPNLTMDAPQAAGAGATEKRDNVPKAMQDEYNSFLTQNIGRLTPQDYARFRAGLDQKYGYPTDSTQMETYRQEGERIGQIGKRGGTVDARIPGPPRKMSMVQQGRNNLVSNPVGAAAAGALNMGGFGGVEALAGDKYNALRDQQPIAMGLGEIAGAIGGTKALGQVGNVAATRLAPRLLGGGAKSQFVRNLATDMGYSGIYGGTTGQDPAMSAIAGGIGSAAGQGVGKGLGAVVGGVRASPAAQMLRRSGIPTTVGQALGGIPKSLEDAATSIPGIGDIINNRRLEGLRAFNQAAMKRAGEPVEAVTSNLGEQGVQDLLDQVGGAYDNATAGVNIPLDDMFKQEIAAARNAGGRLPPDYAPRLSQALNNRVGPIEQSGQLTGKDYQQAMRGIKGHKAAAAQGAPGFEMDYKDALSLAQDALNGQMQRGGGTKVTQSLARADRAYRATKTLKRATEAAKNGTGSGEVQVFTPAQLNSADYAQAAKFGGQRMFGDLGDAGQSVLPSRIPDSGTGRRVMQGALASAIGGGGIGAGLGYGGGDTADGAMKGAAVGALAAIGGTKAGQQLITDALIGRPESLKKLGALIRKHQGLLGSASVPLFLESTK